MTPGRFDLTTNKRPYGVTLLSALHILLGILLLLGGLALLTVEFVLPEMFPQVRWFAMRSTTIGIGLLVFALIYFVLAYGLWNGRGWAWTVSLIFAAIGIVISVLSLFVRPGLDELLSLILDLVIIYYLMQPRVQAVFGRGPSLMMQSTAPHGSTAVQGSDGMQATGAKVCSSCGAPKNFGLAYCSNCGAKLT
jgi:hypothetical protein